MAEVEIAIIQKAPIFLNLNESVALAVDLISDCASRGVSIIAFPETWLPGYPVWLDVAPGAGLWDHEGARSLFRTLFEQSVQLPGAALNRIGEAARAHGVYVVMGAHERLGGTLYNSIFYFEPHNGEPAVHRKLMPTYTERLIWGRGDGSTLTTVETPHGILGGLICWEHWMPLARAAMHALKETIHVAQWPAVREMNQVASRHYAFEGGCFVLAAGCCLSRGQVLAGFDSLVVSEPAARHLLEEMPGADTDLLRDGGSAVIGPDGNYLAGPVYASEETLFATLDLAKINEARLLLDSDGHYARPDVFQLDVNTTPQRNVRFSGPTLC